MLQSRRYTVGQDCLVLSFSRLTSRASPDTNTWNAKSFPFLSTALFTSDGSRYNQVGKFETGQEHMDPNLGPPPQTAVFGTSSLRLDPEAL